MPDLSNYDLIKEDEEARVAAPSRSPGLWIAIAALVFGAGIAIYVLFSRQTAAPAVAPARAEAPAAPVEKPAVALPPLDDSDSLVRQLARTVSSSPALVSWLATDDLIRNFALGVSNVSDGKSPAKQLARVRPTAKFAVVERGGAMQIDPKSYARYDALATAVSALDPAASAQVYNTLKPRIEEAYKELGPSSVSFDQVLEEALVTLLKTPIQAEPVRVAPKGAGYGYAAKDVEELLPAQKQLLRLGPRNARMVKSSLRSIALALGIPAGRLPAPGDVQ